MGKSGFQLFDEFREPGQEQQNVASSGYRYIRRVLAKFLQRVVQGVVQGEHSQFNIRVNAVYRRSHLVPSVKKGNNETSRA